MALYCSGTATASGSPVRHLELLVDETRHAPEATAMPRFDVPARRSGFWGIVPVRVPSGAQAVVLRAELMTDGEDRQVAELGRIPVRDTFQGACHGQPPAESGAQQVAICLATFEPSRRLLEAQLESLRAQTDTRWTCVISDDCSSPESYALIRQLVDGDERFVLSRSPERIGFYRNFERALTLAPPSAQLVALCDQDDVWYPEKLELLRRGLGSAGLVYCDQRLVDPEGRLLRPTMWRGRANNHTNLASMLMANTITGAGSLMRREIVELALPFPDSPGIEFHDHWLGLVALACGEVSYLDQALYDYVQHQDAVLGKVARRNAAQSPRRRPMMREWRAAYFLGYIPGQVRARTLLLRCGHRLSPAKRRGLERYLASDRSLVALAWLLLRPLRALVGRNETLGTEWELARGVVWRRLAGALARLPALPERFLLDCRFPDPPHYESKRLQRWRSRL